MVCLTSNIVSLHKRRFYAWFIFYIYYFTVYSFNVNMRFYRRLLYDFTG